MDTSSVGSSHKCNERMCCRYKRQGHLSGSSIDGFSPPVYSYSLSTGPSTQQSPFCQSLDSIFFTLRLSAISPKLIEYILCLHILLIPSNMRLLESDIAHRRKLKVIFMEWKYSFQYTV